MPDPLSDVLEATPRKPSDVMAEQVRDYRKHRGWSQRDFCNVLATRFGVTINPATVARLETGQRRITVDEAAMFAVALDVPLLSLFWPIHDSQPVSVAPGIEVSPWRALEWAIGNDPLPDVATDHESWNRAFHSIGMVVTLLNVSELADVDRVRSPAEKYRERLQELAKYLYEADEIGLATEGMIPEQVLEDLEREIGQAPMVKERHVRQQREES